jgi:translation elongation factor EF-Tu-like GTPase
MHIYEVIVIVQQYGLPEILPLLNRVDVVLRDL